MSWNAIKHRNVPLPGRNPGTVAAAVAYAAA